jgi:hypothetical protein
MCLSYVTSITLVELPAWVGGLKEQGSTVFLNHKGDSPSVAVYLHDEHLLIRSSYVLNDRLELLSFVEFSDPIKRDSAALLKFAALILAPSNHKLRISHLAYIVDTSVDGSHTAIDPRNPPVDYPAMVALRYQYEIATHSRRRPVGAPTTAATRGASPSLDAG